MKLRSNCKCHCHDNDHITLHEKPCCVENPTIKEGWEEIKKMYVILGVPENEFERLKILYYLGASRVIGYIILLKDLEPMNAAQMLNDLSKEILKFFDTQK